MNETELLELKKKVDSAKSKVSELQGQKNLILQTLQTEHKCKTIKEAESKAKKLEEEIEEVQEKINNKSEELEDTYPQLYEND